MEHKIFLKTCRKVKMYYLLFSTSTLWNTTERCRGFEDTKDEISSLEASDILKLIFTECATFGLKI